MYGLSFNFGIQREILWPPEALWWESWPSGSGQGGLCSRGKSLPRQVLPFLIHWAAVPQLGDVATWLVLVWIKKFRVVQLREPLGLAADVLQWHLTAQSQLLKNPQNPKSQKIVSSSDVAGNSFVLSIRKKKKAFWRVWFSTTWGKCGWVLLHQIHFSYECWRRADPSGSTWGGDALVILMGSIDESWPDIKLIKLCSFKTQEGVITIWPSSFFILLCYPSSFTLLFQRATKRKVIMINYRKLAATVINR